MKKIFVILPIVFLVFIGWIVFFKPNIAFNFQFHTQIGNGSQIAIPPITPENNIILPNTDTSAPIGTAKRIAPGTWIVNYPHDAVMTTPGEALDALNTYRQKHGRQPLRWDRDLADYAQQRAILFLELRAVDDHKGFIADATNGYFKKFGFINESENASYGNIYNATHMVENGFGGEPDHDGNQLNGAWTDVGIGVASSAIDFIFASAPIK